MDRDNNRNRNFDLTPLQSFAFVSFDHRNGYVFKVVRRAIAIGLVKGVKGSPKRTDATRRAEPHLLHRCLAG